MSMLESFRIRSFRYQWGADSFATWASEMETLLLGWYVLVDTGSPFLVGLVGALRFGGTLLAPLYGVAADRFDRRRLLVGLRLFQGVQAGAVAILALASLLEPWHAFAISGIGGLVRNGENVVRQSLIADTVPRSTLMNAMSLSRLTMDGAKMAGSLAGAALLSRLGMGPAYAAVTACYLASAAFALGIASPTPESSPAATKPGSPTLQVESPFATLRSGFGYMRHQPAIVAIMFLAFLVNLTVFPLTNGLMPVVARDAFAFGPGGLALLLTAVSLGALAGSLALAAFARAPRPERTMLASIVLWHALLLVFTQVSRPDALWPALLVLAVYGAATSGAMVTMSAVLLGTADVAFRGRVMGVRMMAVYGLPLGLLLGGYLSERFGVHHAMSTLAVLGLFLTALACLRWPALLRGTAPSSPTLRPTPLYT